MVLMTEWPSNPLMLVSIEGSSLTLIANMAARGSQLSCPLGVGGKREVFGMTNIVGMTGDGVNDGMVIKSTDVAIKEL